MRTGGKLATWAKAWKDVDPAVRLPARSDVAYSADGKIAARRTGGDVAIEDVTTGKVLRKLPAARHRELRGFALSPDGSKLATVGADPVLRTFDLKAGNKHADLIKDFVDGVDMILLKQSKFDQLTLGDMSALQFSSLIEYTANGLLKYDGQKFAKLQSGGLDIGEEDFLIV